MVAIRSIFETVINRLRTNSQPEIATFLSTNSGGNGTTLKRNTMEALARAIDTAIQNNDYTAVAAVFSVGPTSWQEVGQGEQRSIAAHFIKIAVNTPGFLPKAFASGQMMHVMLEALGHLPSTVDGASDNTLRQMIFDYKVNEEGDYSAAARVLSGMRMEDDQGGVYYTTAAEKTDGTPLWKIELFWAAHCR
jgi:hypothetical protein